MSYDLTDLHKYLSEDTNPKEVVRTLRYAKYALIRSADFLDGDEQLGDRYLVLMELEDEFLKLDSNLKELATRWG